MPSAPRFRSSDLVLQDRALWLLARRVWRILPLWAALLSAALPAGCSREHYRQQADREVGDLLQCANQQAGTEVRDYGVYPDPKSRYFDPYDPDRPPMPPDDPAAHGLMQCVDGKKGWAGWHRDYGTSPFVENPCWEQYLPRDEEGEVALDQCSAFQLALLHSRDYQSQIEELYLSALDVTLERFAFDAQFFGGNSTLYTSQGRLRGGGESSDTLETNSDLEVRKFTTTGGQLVAGVANSLVWQFSGPNQYSANTVLDFSLVQPLLRGAGRAIALEGLTQSERDLLANVRQFDRWRRGFYLQVVVGRDPGPGPSDSGLTIGSLDPGGMGSVGGLLGLLELQQQIRNREMNVVSLRTSVERLDIAFRNNQLQNGFQVVLAQQRLLEAEASLLSLQTAYQTRLDTFKLLLGLPPGLGVRIADTQLNRFQFIAPALTETEYQIARLLDRLRNPEEHGNRGSLASLYPELAEVIRSVDAQIQTVAGDIGTLDRSIPQRKRNLEAIGKLPEFSAADVEPEVIDVGELETRVQDVHEDFVNLQKALGATLGKLSSLLAASPSADAASGPQTDPTRSAILETTRDLDNYQRQLQLIQARARLDAITLVSVDMTPDYALDVARQNRRDWQTARSALVDAWRQIEIYANDLKSDVDVVFSGELGTVDNNPARFRSSNGQLRVGLEFDAPLTRLAERNDYRTALIAFQQAKRAYYDYEDNVSSVLRETLRRMRLNQIFFEVQRSALRLAVVQVDLARESLGAPAEPGKDLVVGDTAARDLVDALTDLLNSQNDLIGVWVDYEALRMSLDFDLGTMQVDRCGMWVDPGEVTGHSTSGSTEPPSPDPAIPLQDVPDLLEIVPAPPAEPVRVPERIPIPEPEPIRVLDSEPARVDAPEPTRVPQP